MVNRRNLRHSLSTLFILFALIFSGSLLYRCLKLTSVQTPPSRTSTVTLSQLESVLQIAEFSSIENIYNAVATQTDADGRPVYYVAYRGSVSAGIDYSKVHISIDESTKEIIITLPTPQILDATVDMGSLEYIFLDEDYETESVAIDAYRLCVSSLQQRVETEEKLLSMAKESAIDTTRALFEPLLGQVDSGYVLVIR